MRGEVEGIRSLLITGSRYMLWIVLPFQIGLVLLGKPFLTLWMGARYAESTYPTLVILAAPLALAMTQALGIRALFGTGKLDWYARAVMVEAIANLLLSVALARPLGIEGVALGTAIPNIAFNLALMVFLCRQFAIGLFHYVIEVFLWPLLPASLLAFAWAVTVSLLIPRTWPMFFGTGLCGLLAYGSVAVLVEFGPKLVIQVIQARIRALVYYAGKKVGQAFQPDLSGKSGWKA